MAGVNGAKGGGARGTVEKGGKGWNTGGNRWEQGVYRVTGCECDKYKSNGAWVMTSAMTWIVR